MHILLVYKCTSIFYLKVIETVFERLEGLFSSPDI